MAKRAAKGGGKPIPRVEVSLELSAAQRDELIRTLQRRFENNMNRHTGIEWSEIQSRLEAHPEKVASLNAMEHNGGEPDVVGYDRETDEYVFVDCSAETPYGRRSICYDGKGEQERVKKGIHPGGNAVDLAAAMGIELLDEAQYRKLQAIGEFDTKTSSWLKTPPEIRKLGGAIFGDRRYDHVFVYHNGAQSFYGARGFRGALRV